MTTTILNNGTKTYAFYTYIEIPVLEQIIEVQFRLGQMRVFIIDQVDFVSLGSAQSSFGQCLSDGAVSTVANQFDPDQVTCAVSTDCATNNQLQAQIATISTSVGAAGGGSVGCFCGSCLVAVVFYRRKKKAPPVVALVEDPGTNTSVANLLYTEAEEMNPLFSEQ